MAESTYIILGAGVIGLTTALELHSRLPSQGASRGSSKTPNPRIIILAKHLPGDLSLSYTSPWAGANWLSVATDNGRQESWDEVTYRKFEELADNVREAGVQRMGIRAIFDNEPANAGVLSQGTGKIWYNKLTGGIRDVAKSELPKESNFGFEIDTFIVNVTSYLPWLQTECLKANIEIRRKIIDSLDDVMAEFPHAKGFINCTGLGSYSLKGVDDKSLYPTLGQVMLVESTDIDINKMYFRSPARTHSDTTYVFPRGKHGGIILGGCRIDNVWAGEVSLDFAEDIKRRCCALAPELGRPEDLKVIKHGLGLRPSRQGGARIERDHREGRKVVHNYGAGGAGYQASWGMAKEAVDLLLESSRL